MLTELIDGYFKKGGNKPIAAFYYGVRHTTANKAINKPEDMKGLKLRVPDAPLYIMFPKVVGANADADRLRRGLPRAAEQAPWTRRRTRCRPSMAKKFYEVQTHINLTGHITEMLLTIVGGHSGASSRTPTRRPSRRCSSEAAREVQRRDRRRPSRRS